MGFTHDLQNQWSDNFSFMQVCAMNCVKATSLVTQTLTIICVLVTLVAIWTQAWSGCS